MSLDFSVSFKDNLLMKDKIRSIDNRKKEILNLLDSMDLDKLGIVHGIILTAMLVQEASEDRQKADDKK